MSDRRIQTVQTPAPGGGLDVIRETPLTGLTDPLGTPVDMSATLDLILQTQLRQLAVLRAIHASLNGASVTEDEFLDLV